MTVIPEASQVKFETGSGGVTVRGAVECAVAGQELVMYCVRMAPGAATAPSRRERGEVFLVTTGAVVSTQDGVEALAESGDLVVVPPAVLHSATAGASGATLVVASPSSGGVGREAEHAPHLSEHWREVAHRHVRALDELEQRDRGARVGERDAGE
jgi:quercetin dioxygenase-like cupin family protein